MECHLLAYVVAFRLIESLRSALFTFTSHHTDLRINKISPALSELPPFLKKTFLWFILYQLWCGYDTMIVRLLYIGFLIPNTSVYLHS